MLLIGLVVTIMGWLYQSSKEVILRAVGCGQVGNCLASTFKGTVSLENQPDS